MAEYDPSRTYALKTMSYALVDPRGVPLSLHASFDQALGSYARSRKPPDIILDRASRLRVFKALNQNKYSIRKAFAWCRIGIDKIDKLPPEKRRKR